MTAKYKRLYAVHFLFPDGALGMQIVKGNNAKEARKRFYKRFPSKKRRHVGTSRYWGSDSWLVSSAI